MHSNLPLNQIWHNATVYSDLEKYLADAEKAYRGLNKISREYIENIDDLYLRALEIKRRAGELREAIIPETREEFSIGLSDMETRANNMHLELLYIRETPRYGVDLLTDENLGNPVYTL